MDLPEQDTASLMQQMLDKMSQLQQRIIYLEGQLQAGSTPITKPVVSTTRRKVLRRLAAGLLAGTGLIAATAVLPGEAKAKLTGKSGRIGALITPDGDGIMNDLPTGTYKYGLLALSGTGTVDLSNPPYTSDAAVVGVSYTSGVFGSGITGVRGEGTYGVSGSGSAVGIYGQSKDTAVYGIGDKIGVYGNSSNKGILAEAGKFGVIGEAHEIGGMFGCRGGDNGTRPENTFIGAIGFAGSGYFELGNLPADSDIGVYGTCKNTNTNNFAGYFEGNVEVKGDLDITGNLSKGGGSFKIDHPLDPTNKFLYHSFVESPDMLNIYSGIVTLDDRGEAVVKLPDWFEALNSDYRYQLTPIGKPMPGLFIAREIHNLTFKIGGGVGGEKISWLVTGIRQDAWARANRIPVEENKPDWERGTFSYPGLYSNTEKSPRPNKNSLVVG